jgi:hypothetical protein
MSETKKSKSVFFFKKKNLTSEFGNNWLSNKILQKKNAIINILVC